MFFGLFGYFLQNLAQNSHKSTKYYSYYSYRIILIHRSPLYDYTWKEQLMAPVRNVGQMLSGGVKGAAESINTGLSAANEWWDGGSGDADYSAVKMFRNSFFN